MILKFKYHHLGLVFLGKLLLQMFNCVGSDRVHFMFCAFQQEGIHFFSSFLDVSLISKKEMEKR